MSLVDRLVVVGFALGHQLHQHVEGIAHGIDIAVVGLDRSPLLQDNGLVGVIDIYEELQVDHSLVAPGDLEQPPVQHLANRTALAGMRIQADDGEYGHCLLLRLK